MKKIRITAVLLAAIISLAGFAQQVEVKNNSFYINGNKFFVKGIGYEVGALPGKLPWARTFDAVVLRADMQRILRGGFNTIRTWGAFTAQELDVLKEFDIKIIMGIWVEPAGNFSDKAFSDQAKAIVSGVLSYSKRYNNIIAYLIMNEPLPEAIAAAGYSGTVTLWNDLAAIIRTAHPNRPVSIANTPTGTYIDPAVFDFSAYNVYIYKTVTVNYLHGYRDYTAYLNKLKNPGPPLIITEYGLSVSPSGPGNMGYGGNSLAVQEEGILHMYKSLVDGGAAGSCVFNYSDGWWKAGNEFVHTDAAEEWFGLVNYTSVTDKFGQERPVWKAVRKYQSAIITQPRSSEIYGSSVPLEVFSDDTIARIDIVLDNKVLFKKSPVPAYFADTLVFTATDPDDALLVFNCYDAGNNLVKREEKRILVAGSGLPLPAVKISIANKDYWKSGYIDVDYTVDKPSGLTAGTRLDYVFYPHVGFNYGDQYQWTMPAGSQVKMSARHYFNGTVNVITVGAAFDVTYGSFRKRIVNQLVISRINTIASGIEAASAVISEFRIYPNPSKEVFYISGDIEDPTRPINGMIINSQGATVMQLSGVVPGNAVDLRGLKPGVYYIRLAQEGKMAAGTVKLVKM
jgi:hypothetical protein